MPWAQESAFRRALRKIEDKATEERLQRATELALAESERGAPLVAALVLQEVWRRKPKYKCVLSARSRTPCVPHSYAITYTQCARRIRLFYALSAIARRSVAEHGARSRYGACGAWNRRILQAGK